ncbi:MAG: winged helix-turn-helix domain-containing protein [Oscillibacter sp.]
MPARRFRATSSWRTYGARTTAARRARWTCNIRTLRQKLGAYGEKIETVRGVGYRMEGKA